MNMVLLCHLQKGVGCVGAVWIRSALDGIFKSSLMFPVRFHFTFNPAWKFTSPPLCSLHHLPYGGVDCPHRSPLQECLRALRGAARPKIHLRKKKKTNTCKESLLHLPPSNLFCFWTAHFRSHNHFGYPPTATESNVWISISRQHHTVPHSVRFLWFPIRGI